MLRYGVAENVEIRFAGEYYSNRSTIDNQTSTLEGIKGLSVGTKIQFRKNEKLITNAAMLVHFNLPFGNLNFKPDRFEPSIFLLLAQDINETFSLGVNVGLLDNSQLEQYTYAYSTAVGIALTKKISVFIELYGDLYKKFSPVHNFDCGITYLHLQNLQLDFSVGKVIVGNNTNYFGGLGISLRLPD